MGGRTVENGSLVWPAGLLPRNAIVIYCSLHAPCNISLIRQRQQASCCAQADRDSRFPRAWCGRPAQGTGRVAQKGAALPLAPTSSLLCSGHATCEGGAAARPTWHGQDTLGEKASQASRCQATQAGQWARDIPLVGWRE